jgi:hypothetical protein
MPIEHLPTLMLDSLAGYPRWFVAACLTVVLAAGLWATAKLLKWSLYLLVALVLLAGLAVTAWLFWQ